MRPGANLSNRGPTASGVISRTPNPVPPVVSIKSESLQKLSIACWISLFESGTILVSMHSKLIFVLLVHHLFRAGPDLSSASPLEHRSLTVKIETLNRIWERFFMGNSFMKKYLPVIVITLILICAITAAKVIYRLIQEASLIRETLIEFVDYVQQHKRVGSVIYVVGFGVLSLFLIPTSLPTIIAGFVFKPWPVAVLISLIGSQALALLK